MREVDYLIIGAGIAGMTLHRYLESDDVVIVDSNPGRYKIGESIIPPHFFPRELRGLLDEARRLPSASDKLGTIFVSDEGVSYFFAYYDAQFTLHLDRRELEALYRRHFGIPVQRERVVDIDFDARIVETDAERYRVRRQILDCSGPAMVVARKLGLAYELWPAYAGWAYWDIEAQRDERFWSEVASQKVPFFHFDDRTEKLAPASIDLARPASSATMLTHAGEGLWTWQIPLYHSTLLSFGVVRRHGPVRADDYLEITRSRLGRQYDAVLRPWDRSSPHNMLHRRDHFAWAAREFARPEWALIGDAAFFGDPVYSVGTGIASNQAIRAATLLRRYGWEEGGWKIFHRKTTEIFDRAKRAYEHWYAGEVTADHEVASSVQAGFLNGLALHFHTGEMYQDMIGLAAPDDPSCDPRFAGDPGEEVTELLPDGLRALAGWTLKRAILRNGQAETTWEHAEGESLAVRIELREGTARYYRAAGPFALSYRVLQVSSGPSLGRHGARLFDELARALLAWQSGMLRLLELRPALGAIGT